MKKYSYILSGATVLTASLLLFNCSGISTGTVGGTTGSDFSSILGEDMVLTSPTAQRAAGSLFSTGPKYTVLGDVIAMVGPDPEDSPKEKKDALEALIAETPPTSCAIALNMQNAGRANCYGPSVAWTDHEYDGLSGNWPGGDLGIWTDTEASSGEACVAAQLNQQMKGAISFIDTAQFIAAGIACVANKNGLTLPSSPSSSLDLTSAMSGVVTINSTAMTVTAAEILRDANDGSGNAVYVTTLEGTVGTKTFQIRVKHIPTATDDSTNKGKISVKVSNSGGGTDGASLEYEKTSSTAGKLLLKKINFNAAGADPFVSASDYTVDYSKAWNNNADYLLASINPSNFTGTYSYAWQAGNGDSHTRTFNAILSESGGTVDGTAFFGYGPTMQAGPGSITGMICAWTGPEPLPGGNKVVSPKVQRQDLTLSSGKFTVSGTTHTTFDPVNDCEADPNIVSGTTMVMSWNDGVSQTRSVSDTTENLSPLSDVASALTLPTPPANVD